MLRATIKIVSTIFRWTSYVLMYGLALWVGRIITTSQILLGQGLDQPSVLVGLYFAEFISKF